jgi:hypothetical protein
MLADRFGWGLREIGETDIEELIPFVLYYTYWKNRSSDPKPKTKKTTCDQVSWL